MFDTINQSYLLLSCLHNQCEERMPLKRPIGVNGKSKKAREREAEQPRSVIRSKNFIVILRSNAVCSGGCLKPLPNGTRACITVEWTERIISSTGNGSRENIVGKSPSFTTDARIVLDPYPRAIISIAPIAGSGTMIPEDWNAYHEPVISVRHVHSCRTQDAAASHDNAAA